MTQNMILSRECFKDGMQKLEVVFQDKKITQDFLKVYYERLRFYSDIDFTEAINNVLDNEQWFPSIKTLLRYLPALKQYINEDKS